MSYAKLLVRRKIADTLYGEVLECEIDTATTTTPTLAAGDESSVTARNSVVTVAVKCISLDVAAEKQAAQAPNRLIDDPMQELRVARAMMDADMHPNVVCPLAQIIQEGELFLVSEYCDGGDLYELLEAHKSAGGMPEQQALALMRQVFHGVRFLHEQCGIAHRDLSLENVLLSGGVCKISDFALSVDARGATPCSRRAGKDFYMAPEVVADGPYDPFKADIWSLGIMWFILLTGSRLVPLASRDDSSFAALEQYGVGTVLGKWGYGQRITPETVALLAQMLCVDASKRIDLAGILASPVLSERTPVSIEISLDTVPRSTAYFW